MALSTGSVFPFLFVVCGLLGGIYAKALLSAWLLSPAFLASSPLLHFLPTDNHGYAIPPGYQISQISFFLLGAPVIKVLGKVACFSLLVHKLHLVIYLFINVSDPLIHCLAGFLRGGQTYVFAHGFRAFSLGSQAAQIIGLWGTSWGQECVEEDTDHFMGDRKQAEQGPGDQMQPSDACPPTTHFLQLGPTSKVPTIS